MDATLNLPQRPRPRSVGQDKLTPREYIEAISGYARQTLSASLYPGELYEKLARYLQDDGQTRPPEHTRAARPHEGKNRQTATLYTFSASGDRDVQTISTTEELCESLDSISGQNASDSGLAPRSSILFLRGYPSPEWLSTVGSMLQVDPVFFQRHLDIHSSFGKRNCFFSPSLPSTTEGMLSLPFITIGSDIHGTTSKGGQRDIDELRDQAIRDMDQYLHSLSTGRDVKPGDSIVREYHVHDASNFSMLQEMSIWVEKVSSGYVRKFGHPYAYIEDMINLTTTGLVWMDVGEDISQGPAGPWHRLQCSPPFVGRSPFYPTLQHLPKIALKWHKLSLAPDRQLRGKFAQSAAILHTDYGKALNKQLMAEDPFYALSELFIFSAFSISQFLNMVDVKVTSETGLGVVSHQQFKTHNLGYHKELLEKLARRLEETGRNIEQRGSPLWPRSVGVDQKSTEVAVSRLYRDYEVLLHRTNSLIKRCKDGMLMKMNQATITESKRAIQQAQKVEQLTVLAFFYAPLSFTASFFSMDQGTAGKGYWIWFAVSIPCLMFSYLVLGVIMRRFRNFRESH
ncbi:hypothetical protein ASPWEDRAFT_167883 [Aspergillus wentii DTO 134E9]|uniref:Uncharacterized protein n=1 Tax=Aspergillus wentii DTO 134E9 TaxID=1073089 RepID=A0A1L9S3Y9_ASPWE|nr:uncharacterized protein ASPWEDRAFT_167883 [Aspergillus wentii DTO 134E9]KAI9930215.1 hypothetical protein MW887_012027 [Aspergillus wentii]OJJ41889.1 hypothetical protein ASPWEDRAFT_167883 [Aspergillus wentii DTO 134E9]